MIDTLEHKGIMAMLLVIVGMFINWGIEARKWQMLIRPLQPMSFLRSFSAILSGVSLSINTPNRIGEYGGRVLYVRNNRSKLKAIAATMVGSFSQLLVTIIFGLIGCIYFIANFTPVRAQHSTGYSIWEKISFGVLLIICGLVILLYFRLQIILSIFDRIPLLRKARVFVQIIVRYSTADLERLLLLSALRYAVFSAQYLILLDTLGVEMLWWQGFLMNAVIYLVMAMVPTIAIAELGLRGKVSLYFMGFLSMNSPAIIAATVLIWLVNLVLPAVMGSVALLGIKIIKEK
jgi:uncharacterized membrane protein YbhN (UPF0104 family)